MKTMYNDQGMIMWNEWGDLKWAQKPTKQIEIDGGLFLDTVLNK